MTFNLVVLEYDGGLYTNNMASNIGSGQSCAFCHPMVNHERIVSHTLVRLFWVTGSLQIPYEDSIG